MVKRKSKIYSNELTTMDSLLFVYKSAFKYVGEEEEKGKEPTTLNRGIM